MSWPTLSASSGTHTCKGQVRERRWVLLKIPRCDIDGVMMPEKKNDDDKVGEKVMMVMFITITARD